MAKKKVYAVLNNVLHGVGSKHRQLRAGDEVDLEEDDDTTRELLRLDYIEDPENPKKRTPEQKMHLEERQIAGAAVPSQSAAAAQRELATNRRTEALEEKILAGTASDEERAEAKRIAKSKADDSGDGKPNA